MESPLHNNHHAGDAPKAWQLFLMLAMIGLPSDLGLVVTSRGATSQQITPTPSLITPRQAPTTTLLADGRVLILGGVDSGGIPLASAEVYDPSGTNYTAVGLMAAARQGHTATLLKDGRVLVAGGTGPGGSLQSFEIFDPATGQFSVAGVLSTPRSGHTANLLSDGRVFIAGGDSRGTAEVVDPDNALNGAGPFMLAEPRTGHSATTLSDHSIYLAGGSPNPTAELFNPADFTTSLMRCGLSEARIGHSALSASDNQVYLFGGDAGGSIEADLVSLADTQHPPTNLGSLGFSPLLATPMANHRALVLGTADAGVFFLNPPSFDTATNQINGQLLLRTGAAATSLSGDGKVLVTGGVDASNQLVGAGALFNPARISTDRNDYPEGSVVSITGTGYLPGETVIVQVLHDAGANDYDNATSASHQPWTITADGNGDFLTSWLVPADEDEFGATLAAIATGQSSGISAKVGFTDGGCVSVPLNLLAWWKAEGNATDFTGNFNGTLGGSASFVPGEVGQAFWFDGSASPFVSIPSAVFPFPSSSPFTFETWFQTTAGGIILGQQAGVAYGAPGGWVPAVYVGTDGFLRTEMFWIGTIHQAVSPARVNDGKFHHLAVTYDGTHEITYLDGVAIGSQVATQQGYAGSYHYQLGTGYGYGWPATPSTSGTWYTFSGLIDETSVYSRALSATEVSQIFAAGTNGKCVLRATGSIPDQSATYGVAFAYTVPPNTFTGPSLTYTASGMPPGIGFDGPSQTFSGTPTAVGTYTVTVTAIDSSAPSSSANASFHLTVNPASLTIKADNQTKPYGAALPSLTASYSGFVNGDTPASLTTQPTLRTTATASSHVDGGPYGIQIGGAAAANYTITYVAGSLTITPVGLTITAENQSKGYGAALPALTASYSGFVNGDTPAALTVRPTLSTPATEKSHASGGPFPITVSGALDPDYTISYVAGSLTISPGTLTITADNQTKAYGAPIPTLTASYSGFVNGDTAASLTTQPTLSTTATASSHVSGGPYPIAISGAVDPDYTISYVAGSLTITPVPLTITADNQTKPYGAAMPTLAPSYSGFMNGDTPASLTTQPTLNTAATASSHVGGNPYPITVTGAVDPDYTISYVAGSLTITPVPLTITADNKNKIYGDPLPTLTATYSGLVNGDTPATFSAALNTAPTITTTATTASPVSGNPYTITASGAVDNDYAISYGPGTLIINQAALTITANNQSKAFATTFTPDGTRQFTASGLRNGDTANSVTLSSGGYAASAPVADPGPSLYAIVPSAAVGSGLSNYTITYVNGTLTVSFFDPACKTMLAAISRARIHFHSTGPTFADFQGNLSLPGGLTPAALRDAPVSQNNQSIGHGRVRVTIGGKVWYINAGITFGVTGVDPSESSEIWDYQSPTNPGLEEVTIKWNYNALFTTAAFDIRVPRTADSSIVATSTPQTATIELQVGDSTKACAVVTVPLSDPFVAQPPEHWAYNNDADE